MRPKNLLIISSWLWLGGIFLSLSMPVQARVDLRPELYRQQSRTVSYYNDPDTQLFSYPASPSSAIFWTDPDLGKVINLSAPGTGGGIMPGPSWSVDTQDGLLMETDFTTQDQMYRPLYFIFNYQNAQNYQMFHCLATWCEFQQQRGGQPVHDQPIRSPLYQPLRSAQRYRARIFISRHLAQLTLLPFDSSAPDQYDQTEPPILSVNLDARHLTPQKGNLLLFHYWPENFTPDAEATTFPLAFRQTKFTGYQLKSDRIERIFRQTDSRWKNQQLGQSEYTLGSHGCAVTSAAMVLNYWGHQRNLQTGEALTPASLNAWLQSEKDGYHAGSLLNWQAVSRFTRLNHQLAAASAPTALSPTATSPANPALWPQLGFTFYDGASASDRMNQDLQLGRPSIIRVNQQTTGGYHFLVATNNHDPDRSFAVRIADPYYTNYQYLTEQTRITGAVNGVRRVTPDLADLSYWLILSPNSNLRVTATELSSRHSVTLPAVVDRVTDPATGVTTPALYQYYFARPPSGHYQLSVQQTASAESSSPVPSLPERWRSAAPASASATYQVWFYDQDANYDSLSQRDFQLTDTTAHYYDFNYFKDSATGVTTLQPLAAPLIDPDDESPPPHPPVDFTAHHWADLLTYIDQARATNHLSQIFHYLLTQQLIYARDNSLTAADHQRYQAYLIFYLQSFRHHSVEFFTPDFYQQFLSLIESLPGP